MFLIKKTYLGMIIISLSFISLVNAAYSKGKWFKGQLHTHSYWSDGRAFPEQAIMAYKQRDYDFLSITDHNRFASKSDEWREVFSSEGTWPPKVSQKIFNDYLKTYGKDWVDIKKGKGKLLVRLKTYLELKKKFEEAGKFLLLPGVELTQHINIKNTDLHVNYINIPEVIPCVKNSSLIHRIKDSSISMENLLRINYTEAKQSANKLKCPSLVFANHPFWPYYDIDPQVLINNPEVRFFEICNCGSSFAPSSKAPDYTLDKFWDIVNAFRALKGQKLLYGIASDDAHFYDSKRINLINGVGDAWIMVRSDSLTADNLFKAMKKGDFYATCGVLLKELSFNPTDRTLHLKVKSEKNVSYRIHFITTKKNFDKNFKTITITAKGRRPKRTISLYSKDIGKIVKTVAGTEAIYKLAEDDLYVRAKIESSKPCHFKTNFHPKKKSAWTQAYTIPKR